MEAATAVVRSGVEPRPRRSGDVGHGSDPWLVAPGHSAPVVMALFLATALLSLALPRTAVGDEGVAEP
jgi:hypothetical protein